MKTTTLKASNELAEKIANDLLSLKGPKNRNLFIRTMIENGFEIKGLLQGIEIVVFRFTDPGGKPRFDYDEKLIILI